MNDLILKGKITIHEMEFNHIEGGFRKGKKSILVKDIADINDRELREINERINLNRIRFKDGIDIMDLKGTEFEIGLTDNGIYTQNGINRSKNIYLLSELSHSGLKQDLINQEKKKLDKAVITSNYLIAYISSINGQVPQSILDSFTTTIQAVNIDIIGHLRNTNKP